MEGQQTVSEDEAALVIAAQGGDIEAFNQLVTRYQRQVFGLCCRMLGDRDAAEDAAQESFWRAYAGLCRFRGGPFRPWLLRIATNICRDALRRRRRRPVVSLSDQSHSPDPQPDYEPVAADAPLDERLLRHELSAAIARCLAALPEPQRAILILCDIEGLSYEEIGQATRTPVGTVKSRLSRARARLRDLLRDEDLLPQRYRPQAAQSSPAYWPDRPAKLVGLANTTTCAP